MTLYHCTMLCNFLEFDDSSVYNMVKFHNMVKLKSMNILELGSSVPHSYIPYLETLFYTLLASKLHLIWAKLTHILSIKWGSATVISKLEVKPVSVKCMKTCIGMLF